MKIITIFQIDYIIKLKILIFSKLYYYFTPPFTPFTINPSIYCNINIIVKGGKFYNQLNL